MSTFLWICLIWGLSNVAFVGAWWAWTEYAKRIGAWEDEGAGGGPWDARP
jgi:hypothetical protein